MFYTYVWKDSSGSPFYVGKGKGRRAGEVYPYRRSKEFMDVYARGGCAVEIVGEFAHESDAHVHEIELIDKYGKPLSDGHKEKIGRGLRMAPPSSGFKGVGFDKSRSKWVAKIKLDGKTVNLGRFKDHEDAARAYDAAAIKAWGLGNCYLNFPLDEADDLIARPN